MQKLYTSCEDTVVSPHSGRALAAAAIYAGETGVHVQGIIQFAELSDRGRRRTFWAALRTVMDREKKRKLNEASALLAHEDWVRFSKLDYTTRSKILQERERQTMEKELTTTASAVWTQYRNKLLRGGIGFRDMHQISAACARLVRVAPAHESTMLAAMLMLRNRFACSEANRSRNILARDCPHADIIAGTVKARKFAPFLYSIAEMAALTGVSACSVRRQYERLIGALPPPTRHACCRPSSTALSAMYEGSSEEAMRAIAAEEARSERSGEERTRLQSAGGIRAAILPLIKAFGYTPV